MQTDRLASFARWAALTLGTAGLGLLAFGLFGLAVVAGDWMPCLASQATASLNSLPGGYCETTDWVRQFGIGVILATAGMVGIVVAVLLLRPRRSRSRGIQRR